MKYHGRERGSSILNLGIENCIIYDGSHYCKYDIPYIEDKDSKKGNVQILVTKSVRQKVHENVRKEEWLINGV